LAIGSAGPLTGLPLAHKDIFCTSGVRTSCGSRMLDNFVSPYDATVVEKLNASGMVDAGQDEHGRVRHGLVQRDQLLRPGEEPVGPEAGPGRSSGGSAAAVAARVSPIATATDTGGSIRQPASLCGVTGIKPTYGRVSRFGMIAFASSLDQGGLIAQSAEDCRHGAGRHVGIRPARLHQRRHAGS
jgi:aspartyl-tRNA(Asn)/glutamyl-tRNA(Gln) amidotransferase subunit A